MNIRMRGDTGELFGRNLGFAFMGNGMEGEGETTIESCDIENCVYGLDISRGVNYSAYIEDNYLFNLRTGIWIGFLQNSSIAIERNEIEGGIVQGIFLRGPSDASITGNTFKDFAGPGVPWRGPIVLWRDSHESFVAGNTFINIQGAGAAICVNTRENTLLFNDYRQSNLPGWMDTHPDGPGCVIFFGMTEGNVVAECLFPDGTTTSDQIRDLTDNPGTPEYDGRNMILTCSESLIFLINELLSEVERLVDEGKLNHGQGNSLVVKLEGALKQLENGKSQAACNKLGAFINEVNAHIRSGKLFLEDVALLIEGAGIIKTSLCG
ncbi:MAG: right-handed parallel beta-helix repeat-containing protein [Candidatus Aminicenantes bacterium]